MARTLLYRLLGVVLATFLVFGQVESASHDILDNDPAHQYDCTVCHLLSDDDDGDTLLLVRHAPTHDTDITNLREEIARADDAVRLDPVKVGDARAPPVSLN